jgi:hypothetical protein
MGADVLFMILKDCARTTASALQSETKDLSDILNYPHGFVVENEATSAVQSKAQAQWILK